METLGYEEQAQPRPPRSADLILNILTVVILLVVVAVVGIFWSIFSDPNSAYNLFPPPTLPAVASVPTLTPTPNGMLAPTWTPTVTREPTLTPTLRPSSTPIPTATPFILATNTPSQTSPEPTVTFTRPPGGYAFVVEDRPFAVPNIAHPEVGCNWMGVAGKVVDMSGGPKTQLIVVLGGYVNGKAVGPSGLQYSLTGVAPSYGQAGYEFVLADKPVASKGSLWIQLLDQSEQPLSEKVYFDTYDTCDKNLIVISFKQVK